MSPQSSSAPSKCSVALIEARCGDVILALSENGASPDDARTIILSLAPSDGVQMLIAGQAALFNALTVDAGRDILAGTSGAAKPRAQSNAIAMGRLAAKHINTLIRLQRSVPVQKPAVAEPVPAETPSAEILPAETPPAGTLAPETPPFETPLPGTPLPGTPTAETSAPGTPGTTMPETAAPETPTPRTGQEEISWLDEPYTEWLIETPADIAAAAQAAAEAAAESKANAPMVPPDFRSRAAVPLTPDRPEALAGG